MASAWERWQQENANDQSQTARPAPKSEAAPSGGFFESFDGESFPSTAQAGSPASSSQHGHGTSSAISGALPTTQTTDSAVQNGNLSSLGLGSHRNLSVVPQTKNKHHTTVDSPAATESPAAPAPTAAHQAPPGWAVINASDAQGPSPPGPSLSATLPHVPGQSASDRTAPHATALPQLSRDTRANVDGNVEGMERTSSGKGLVSLHGPPSGFASLLASATSDPTARRPSHAGSIGAPLSPINSGAPVVRSRQDTVHTHEPAGSPTTNGRSRRGDGGENAQGALDGVQPAPLFDASELPLGAGTAEALAAALRKAREAMPEHSAGVRPQHVASPPQTVPEAARAAGHAEGQAGDGRPPAKRRGIFGLFGRGGGVGGGKAAAVDDAAAGKAAEEADLRDVDAGPASAAALEAAAAAVAAEPATPEGAGGTAAEVARECLRLERARQAQARTIATLEEEVVALREEAAETVGELEAIRQAYADARGEREEAAEQVEQLLDRYCDAVRDTALLVAKVERYRPLARTVGTPSAAAPPASDDPVKVGPDDAHLDADRLDAELDADLAKAAAEPLPAAPGGSTMEAAAVDVPGGGCSHCRRVEETLERERAEAAGLEARMHAAAETRALSAEAAALAPELRRQLGDTALALEEARTEAERARGDAAELRARLGDIVAASGRHLLEYGSVAEAAQSAAHERDELRLAVRAAEALTAAAERRLSEAEADSAAMRARMSEVERQAEYAEAGKATASAEVARLATALQDAFESRDAAEEGTPSHDLRRGGELGSVAAGGAAADVVQWRRAAQAEASARRLLQAAMVEFYGASADAEWLKTQGVAVDDLLGEDDAEVVSGGKEGEGVAAGGDGTEPRADARDEAGEDGGPGVQQGKNAGILGRFFGM